MSLGAKDPVITEAQASVREETRRLDWLFYIRQPDGSLQRQYEKEYVKYKLGQRISDRFWNFAKIPRNPMEYSEGDVVRMDDDGKVVVMRAGDDEEPEAVAGPAPREFRRRQSPYEPLDREGFKRPRLVGPRDDHSGSRGQGSRQKNNVQMAPPDDMEEDDMDEDEIDVEDEVDRFDPHHASREARAEAKRKQDLMTSKAFTESLVAKRKSAQQAKVRPIAIKERIRAGLEEGRENLSNVPEEDRPQEIPVVPVRSRLTFDATTKEVLTVTRRYAQPATPQAPITEDVTPQTVVSPETPWSAGASTNVASPDVPYPSPLRNELFSSMSPVRKPYAEDDEVDLLPYEDVMSPEKPKEIALVVPDTPIHALFGTANLDIEVGSKRWRGPQPPQNYRPRNLNSDPPLVRNARPGGSATPTPLPKSAQEQLEEIQLEIRLPADLLEDMGMRLQRSHELTVKFEAFSAAPGRSLLEALRGLQRTRLKDAKPVPMTKPACEEITRTAGMCARVSLVKEATKGGDSDVMDLLVDHLEKTGIYFETKSALNTVHLVFFASRSPDCCQLFSAPQNLRGMHKKILVGRINVNPLAGDTMDG